MKIGSYTGFPVFILAAVPPDGIRLFGLFLACVECAVSALRDDW